MPAESCQGEYVPEVSTDTSGGTTGDLTRDGFVNFDDLAVLLAHWTGPGEVAAPAAADRAVAEISQVKKNNRQNSSIAPGKCGTLARVLGRRFRAAAVDVALASDGRDVFARHRQHRRRWDR